MNLKQIAQHAGVSTSTVSRVINAVPGISTATIVNVRRSMRAIAATAPARRDGEGNVTWAKIGFAVIGTGVANAPAYQYLLRGVSAAAAERGLDLHVSFIGDAAETVRRLAESAFDGLILHGMIDAELGRPLHDVPTVWLMGNRRRPVWGDQVMPDNTVIGQLAAQYLLRNRHQRAMYFGIRSGWSLGVRMLAFEQAMEDAGASVIAVAHPPVSADIMLGKDNGAITALVNTYKAQQQKPTGLFIAEDWLVRPAFVAFREAGIDVGPGKDLDVVSCNNDRAHLLGVSPTPATIDIRYDAIGRQAIDQLVYALTRRPGKGRVRIMLEPALVTPTFVEN